MDDNVSPPSPRLKPREIARRALSWWDAHRRDLPWRAAPGETPDPYRVWLSEILLQQTTASAAAPYFQDFVARWPRVEALAAASLDEVISAFAGLGYYARARNLHACAREVARRGGLFPRNEATLRALPGVGAYTAAAVAAIAFDEKAAPVDGNIARILARLYALEAPFARARRAIAEAAAALTPAKRPGDFAQALMDIGATICRPRNPDCPACPLRGSCAAARAGEPDAYPRRASAKTQAGTRRRGVLRATRATARSSRAGARPRGCSARRSNCRAGGGKRPSAATSASAEAPFAASWRRLPGEVEQAFTHFALRLTLYAAEVGSSPPTAEGMIWIDPARPRRRASPASC